jgi:hypothetical protein
MNPASIIQISIIRPLLNCLINIITLKGYEIVLIKINYSVKIPNNTENRSS